jgi:hypothetical protein
LKTSGSLKTSYFDIVVIKILVLAYSNVSSVSLRMSNMLRAVADTLQYSEPQLLGRIVQPTPKPGYLPEARYYGGERTLAPLLTPPLPNRVLWDNEQLVELRQRLAEDPHAVLLIYAPETVVDLLWTQPPSVFKQQVCFQPWVAAPRCFCLKASPVVSHAAASRKRFSSCSLGFRTLRIMFIGLLLLYG